MSDWHDGNGWNGHNDWNDNGHYDSSDRWMDDEMFSQVQGSSGGYGRRKSSGNSSEGLRYLGIFALGIIVQYINPLIGTLIIAGLLFYLAYIR